MVRPGWFALIVTTISGLACAAGSDPTIGPQPSDATDLTVSALAARGHPRQDVGRNIVVGGTPFDALLVGSTKVFYTTQQDEGTIVRATLANVVDPPITVGDDPAEIVYGRGNKGPAYVTNLVSGTISVVSRSSNTQTDVIVVPGNPIGLAISTSGRHLYVTNATSLLDVDPKTKTVVNSVDAGAGPYGLALDKAEASIFVGSRNDGTIREVDLGTFTVTRSIVVGGRPHDIALSPMGKRCTRPTSTTIRWTRSRSAPARSRRPTRARRSVSSSPQTGNR